MLVPRCGWLRLLGKATDDLSPACRNRRAARGMVSAPEQASAALRCHWAGHERLFRRAAALASITRFVLDGADGDTSHETRVGCCAIHARTNALNSAHVNLQYAKQHFQTPSVRLPLPLERGRPRSLRTVDPGSVHRSTHITRPLPPAIISAAVVACQAPLGDPLPDPRSLSIGSVAAVQILMSKRSSIMTLSQTFTKSLTNRGCPSLLA